jgi:hypothetical protein
MKKTSVSELLHEGIDQASLDSFNSREILPKIRCDCRGQATSSTKQVNAMNVFKQLEGVKQGLVGQLKALKPYINPFQ